MPYTFLPYWKIMLSQQHYFLPLPLQHMVHVKTDGFSGKMQREAPLHYSNVALVDPEDK